MMKIFKGTNKDDFEAFYAAERGMSKIEWCDRTLNAVYFVLSV